MVLLLCGFEKTADGTGPDFRKQHYYILLDSCIAKKNGGYVFNNAVVSVGVAGFDQCSDGTGAMATLELCDEIYTLEEFSGNNLPIYVN